MRAVVIERAGGPEVLVVREVPDPVPGPGEVVVKLRLAALNHRDVWIRKGQYAAIRLPAIPGSDGVGTVESAGPDVDPGLSGRDVVLDPGIAWGADDRIPGPDFRALGMPDDGTHAGKIRVSASQVHPKPPSLEDAEAAALPLAGLTAYRALVSRARLQSGETILITGIGGGVSSFALQIASALGARVFVTSGSDEKLEKAREMGASGGVNYRSEDWPKAMVRLCGGEGPDVILDSVGGETFAKCLRIVKKGGRIVTYGATTGPVDQFEITRLFWKQVDILGTTMGSPREFASLLEFYEAHRLKPVVDRIFPLDAVADAHRWMESSGQFGKILLDVASS